MVKPNIINVLKITFLTLLITLILDRVAYKVLNHLSDKVYSGQAVGKLNYFMDYKRDAEVLFMGSSRASRHFNSNLIADDSFNIGMDGKMIAYSATLLQTLPLDKQQTIFFQIDPNYAVEPLYVGKDIEALSIKLNRDKVITKNIKKLNRVNQFQRFYRSIAYNGDLVGILFNYMDSNNEYEAKNGFQPLMVTDEQRQKLRIQIRDAETESVDCPEDMAINDIYIDYLKELKEFTEKNNKNLIFVTTPKYIDSCRLDNELLEQLMAELNLIYIDDTDYFKPNDNILNWKDIGHMSSIGSTKYAERVKGLLEELN